MVVWVQKKLIYFLVFDKSEQLESDQERGRTISNITDMEKYSLRGGLKFISIWDKI